MQITVHLRCPLHDSFRVRQVIGMFDLPPRSCCEEQFEVELPDLSEPWQIGAIVGPSGSGKTAVAKRAFGNALYRGSHWPRNRAAIDCFGNLPIKQITHILTAVGFGSPPSWLKPYAVLSNGERFRCELARAMLSVGCASAHADRWQLLSNSTCAKAHPTVVFDEFTSVVDRTVARIGSAAVARAIRSGRINVRFVAVTCHYDVIAWLSPDWVLDMADGKLTRRVPPVPPPAECDGAQSPAPSAAPTDPDRRDCKGDAPLCKGVRPLWNLQLTVAALDVCPLPAGSGVELERVEMFQRPPITLRIRKASRDEWDIFRRHHYLSGSLHRAAQCFVAEIEGRPAAFTAALPFPHPRRPGWREHRTVCLPDFQGIGIGHALSEFVAGMYVSTGKPYFSTSGHPAIIRHRANSPRWRMLRRPSLTRPVSSSGAGKTGMDATCGTLRLTAGFEYIGPARTNEARKFAIIDTPTQDGQKPANRNAGRS
jgi:GNAT superfamily N-acetyltransferase